VIHVLPDGGRSTAPVPAAIAGEEQRATVVPVPSEFTEAWATFPFTVTPGTARAISVDGERPVAFFDAPPQDRGDPSLVFGSFEDRRRADVAQIASHPVPIPAVSTQAVPLWTADRSPTTDQQVFAWTHLPAGTAFVTYDFAGTRLWQRPVWQTAVFVVPRPPDGVSGASHRVLRAYDARGEFLADNELVFGISTGIVTTTTTTRTPPST
jgi:hypothetical protein